MSLDTLLGRLDRVTRIGPGKWKARCPAHEDRTPSLSIRESDDGRILVHCFTGCGAIDVIEALGLDWPDLYPESIRQPTTRADTEDRIRVPSITAADALDLLDMEATVVELIAESLKGGTPVERHARELERAANRISTIRQRYMGIRPYGR